MNLLIDKLAGGKRSDIFLLICTTLFFSLCFFYYVFSVLLGNCEITIACFSCSRLRKVQGLLKRRDGKTASSIDGLLCILGEN